jgi:predicted porin
MNAALKRFTSFNTPALCALTLAVITANSALAAQYSAETRIKIGGEWDDNVQLNSNDDQEIKVSGYNVTPKLNLGMRTERLKAGLDTELRFSRFDSEEPDGLNQETNFDSDDQLVKVYSNYKLLKGELRANARLDRNSTRTSELEDTGVIGLNADRREAMNVALGWTHEFTPRLSTSLDASYEKTEYEVERLNDFDYYGVSNTWTYSLKPTFGVFTRLFANRYEAEDLSRVVGTVFGFGLPIDNAEVEADSYGLMLGFNSAASETLKYSIALGGGRSETQFDSPSLSSPLIPPAEAAAFRETRSENNFFADASLTKQGTRWSTTISAYSRLNPTADGYLLQTNRASLSGNYRLSPLATLVGSYTYLDSSADDERIQNDREYHAAQVGYRHKLTERWYVQLDYRFRTQEREVRNAAPDADIKADSNAVIFSVEYTPAIKTWSR